MMLRRAARGLLDGSLRADGAVQMLWMNVLWLLMSLTVIGAPAATAALHRIVTQRSDGDESPVLPRWCSALRDVAAPATLAGALLAALWGLLAVNVMIATLMDRPLGMAVLGLLGAVAVPLAPVTTVLPSVLADDCVRVRGLPGAVGRRLLREPLDALLRLLAALLIALAALAFPPTLLLLPVPALLALDTLRRRRGAPRSFHPLQERTIP